MNPSLRREYLAALGLESWVVRGAATLPSPPRAAAPADSSADMPRQPVAAQKASVPDAGVALDAAGDIFISGRFAGTVDFNTGRKVSNRITSGDTSYDAYLAKLV